MRVGALGLALFLTTAIVPVRMAWGQEAGVAATRVFSVPAGPLAEALIAYGQQAGRQISYRPAMAQGVRSNGVSGTMTPETALSRLLAGTGLAYRMEDGRTVTLEPAPRAAQEGAVVLPEVSVTASTQRGWSPAPGYVAEVSSTGSKTDTPILEIPQSISVVTRQEIEDRAAQSLVQAAGYMPSVRTPYGEDGRNDFFFLRGFFAGSFLDGLRFPTPTGFYGAPRIEPYGLERFEVLRGPSSVLYGQSSPGGIVNSISKRPTEDPLHEVRLQAGSYGRIQGAVDLSGPVDEDKEWLYRIVGLVRDSGTQIDHSPDDRIFLAPSLTWRPTSQTSITLLTQFQRDSSGIAAARLPARGRVLPNINGHISNRLFVGEPDFNQFERTQALLGYTLEQRFNESWSFRQNLRYARSELERKEVILSALQANQRFADRRAVHAWNFTNFYAVDNQVEGHFTTGPLDHTLLVGLDALRVTETAKNNNATATPLDLFSPVYGGRIGAFSVGSRSYETLDQVGLYVQDQIRYDRWTLTLGGRQDWANGSFQNRLTGVTTKTDDTAFTGRVGLNYRFDNGIAPYISYSESFEPQSGTAFGGASFEPTTGTQYEAGIRYQPPGTNALFSIAAFNLTQQNVLTTDTDPTHICNGFSCSVQEGEVRVRGVELEAKASLARGLNISAAYAYSDAEVTRSNAGTQGKRYAGTAPHQASLWAEYTVPEGALASVGLGAGVRYIGSRYGDAANTFRMPDVTLVDLSLRYDLGQLSRSLEGLRLAVNASNVFNKDYDAWCTSTNINCFVGNGRTVYGTLSYRW